MTSQLQGRESIETLCKDCVFSIYDGDDQSGCEAGRLNSYRPESIKEATDGSKNFYVVKGVCPSYRPPEWGKADLERMRKELRLSFSLVLDVQEYTREQLRDLKNVLEEAYYYEDVEVVLAHKMSYKHKDVLIEMIYQWVGKKKFKLVQYNEDLTRPEIDAELLKHVKGGFFSMSPLDKSVENFMRRMNHDFNTNCETFIAAEHSGMTMVMSSALRFYRMKEGGTYEDFRAELVQGAIKAKLYKKY